MIVTFPRSDDIHRFVEQNICQEEYSLTALMVMMITMIMVMMITMMITMVTKMITMMITIITMMITMEIEVSNSSALGGRGGARISSCLNHFRVNAKILIKNLDQELQHYNPKAKLVIFSI